MSNRINWGNYDLVVIDESHNFRNNDAFRDEERGAAPGLDRDTSLSDPQATQGVRHGDLAKFARRYPLAKLNRHLARPALVSVLETQV